MDLADAVEAVLDFRTLTQAVALDPAMLAYLDRATNLVSAPSENWAATALPVGLSSQFAPKQPTRPAATRLSWPVSTRASTASIDELASDWTTAVTLMTFSELGRRVKANSSGTDHGTASTMLVIRDLLVGGLRRGSVQLR